MVWRRNFTSKVFNWTFMAFFHNSFMWLSPTTSFFSSLGMGVSPRHGESTTKQHLHVENDEEHDEGQGRQDEEEVATAGTHYILDMGHRLREVLDVAQ
jgi:hypothetical protein